MQTFEQFSLSLDKQGATGKYYKIGRGFPIVLLHGFAETFEIWNKLIPTLAENYQLILPQIPGCGNEEKFSEEFSMERIAEFVTAILKKENISHTILFGHSMGGYAAMAFAEKYADKLLGLSLVHSSAAADSAEKIAVRKRTIEHINKNGKDGFFKTLIPKLYGDGGNYSAVQTDHLKMAAQYTAEQVIDCYTAMLHRPDRRPVLAQLKIPVQLIGGMEDTSINYKDLMEQAKLCQNASLKIFETVGHTSMYENPKILLESIIGFADDILQTNEL